MAQHGVDIHGDVVDLLARRGDLLDIAGLVPGGEGLIGVAAKAAPPAVVPHRGAAVRDLHALQFWGNPVLKVPLGRLGVVPVRAAQARFVFHLHHQHGSAVPVLFLDTLHQLYKRLLIRPESGLAMGLNEGTGRPSGSTAKR